MLNILLIAAWTAFVLFALPYAIVYFITVCFEMHDKLFYKSKRTVEEIIVDKNGNVTYI